jgi:hypothetical protein
MSPALLTLHRNNGVLIEDGGDGKTAVMARGGMAKGDDGQRR